MTHSTQPGAGVTNYESTYNVSLGNSHQSLANWNVTHYASADIAKQAYQSTMGAGTPDFSGDPAITLTGNHTAYVTKDGNGATSIRWTEGKWNIRVTALKTEVAPTPVADQVAAYLDKNLMPAPHDVGAINVTTSDMSNSHLQAQVIWQENENLYQVQTTEYASDPVQTALGMAISMKPYQG
ncbi:hypothetical protein [Alicyclobacillus dauci]|uniref:Uncharacterized protein n=1 Tax=Alicyclobacillus dauci TaxID=1475485 RepID=A0ABY6Z404_9BACL|nr:hypothetical protein [Alicyclobacillus dauci]WAH36725.1 hypothetical protein NZD86_21540 [Alicyclobacillus dauci]